MYKAIGANATSSVILYTGKCISPSQEILQLLQVILQPLQDYLQRLIDFQTGANAFTGIQNYTGCCISPYSFVPIIIYSVHNCTFTNLSKSVKIRLLKSRTIYRRSLSYANFISVNFITAVFQSYLAYAIFGSFYFISAIFWL